MLQCRRDWYSNSVIQLPTSVWEYFAAKYVTTLPEGEVYRESFISKSVHLSNMWIIYCGITSQWTHKEQALDLIREYPTL